MRHRVALLALAAACTAPAAAHAWVHNGVIWPTERFPLPITLQPAPPEDTDLDTIALEVQASLDAWNGVVCSFAQLEYVGIEDLPIAIDDDQVFGWTNDDTTWVYGSATAGATIIDVTAGYPRVDIWFNDIDFDWVVGANTFVTPDYEFGVDPPLEVDPGSVITHEVGHLLGLAHPNPQVEGTQPDNLATMVFSLLPNAQQSSLAGDDKIGLCARYPAFGTDECDGDEGCDAAHACETFSVDEQTVQLCEEPRGQVGEFCGIDDYICGDICLFTTADYREGFCTAFCDTVADCPIIDIQWDCRDLPTTAGDAVRACWPEEPTGGDTGIGIVDGGGPSLPDAGTEDVAAEDDSSAQADADAPDALQDAGVDVGSSSGGDDGGCAAAPAPGGALALCAAALALLPRRRRSV